MDKKTPVPFAAKFILAAVSILVCCGIVEIGWRVYLFHFAPRERVYKWARLYDIPKEQQLYQEHPYLPYALTPGYRNAEGSNRVNALGYRGDETTREKPPGAYRIVCLGGSTTWTALDDYTLSYPHLLQKALRERYGHPEVEVINGGVSGYTTYESLLNLELRALDLSPDLVVVYHAINDAKARLIPPERYSGDNAGYRRPLRIEYSVFERSLFVHYLFVQWGLSETNSLERMARRPGVEIPEGASEEETRRIMMETVHANPPIYFERNLRSLVGAARANGAEVLLTSWAHTTEVGGDMEKPWYQEMVREHNGISRRVAEEMRAPFYDFAAEMPAEARYWKDCMHMSEEGAPLKADLFARHIAGRILAASR